MRRRRSLVRSNALLRRVQRHAEIGALYRQVEAPAVAATSGRWPVQAPPPSVVVATLLPNDSTLPTGFVLPGVMEAGTTPAAQAPPLQRMVEPEAEPQPLIQWPAEPAAWTPLAGSQPAAEPGPGAPSAPESVPPRMAAPTVTGATPVQTKPEGPAPVASGAQAAPRARAEAGEQPQPAAEPRPMPAAQEAAIQRAMERVSQPPATPGPPETSETGRSTLTDSDWSRLKTFMEGHQEIVARQKAEEEAVQRTPEAQAKREAEARAAAERQRRIELARSGQVPRAQVVYLSPEEAAVGGGPRPPIPEPPQEEVRPADQAGMPGSIQEAAPVPGPAASEAPARAAEPAKETPAAPETVQTVEEATAASHILQRDSEPAEFEEPAEEARRQTAAEPPVQAPAPAPSPAPAAAAEPEPISKQPAKHATAEVATTEVQRAPAEVRATPPGAAKAGTASGPVQPPVVGVAAGTEPTLAQAERSPEEIGQTPAEQPQGLGRRLLAAARSLFRAEEKASPPPAAEQLGPVEAPILSQPAVQLSPETEETMPPAAGPATTYREEQAPEAEAESRAAADQRPIGAAPAVHRLADEAKVAALPAAVQPAEPISETEEPSEPAQVASLARPPEVGPSPAAADLSEATAAPPPSSVELGKETPATPAVQREIEESAGLPTADRLAEQKQPLPEERKPESARAGSPQPDSIQLEPAQPEPALTESARPQGTGAESARAESPRAESDWPEPTRPEAAGQAEAERRAEGIPPKAEMPMGAAEGPAIVQAELESRASLSAELPEMRPAADEDATLIVPGRPVEPKAAGERPEQPSAASDRMAEPAGPAEPAMIQRKTAGDESRAPGQDEEIEGHELPLEAVWPVTPAKSPVGIPAARPAAGPAETGPSAVEAAAARSAATGKPFVQRKVVSEDKTSEDVHATLQNVAPGRDTDSAIELVTPRRPRPALPEQREEPAGPKPQASAEADTGVQRQAEDEDVDYGEEALPPAPGRTSPSEPTMIPTAIGDLPSDLWEILGERPPEPRPQRPAQGPAPSEGGPTNGLVQRAEAAVALQAPPRLPLELALEEHGFGEDWVQRVETAPGAAAAETTAATEPEAKKAAEPDIDELAHKVYAEIKQRLISEYERSRGRF